MLEVINSPWSVLCNANKKFVNWKLVLDQFSVTFTAGKKRSMHHFSETTSIDEFHGQTYLKCDKNICQRETESGGDSAIVKCRIVFPRRIRIASGSSFLKWTKAVSKGKVNDSSDSTQ
jgi:hypothetical protein